MKIQLRPLASYAFRSWDYFHVSAAGAVNFNQLQPRPSSPPPPPPRSEALLSLPIKATRFHIFLSVQRICHFWSFSVSFFLLFLPTNAIISLSPCAGCKLSEETNISLSERGRHTQFLRLLWQRTLCTSLSASLLLCGLSACFLPRLSRSRVKDLVFRTSARMFLPPKGRTLNTFLCLCTSPQACLVQLALCLVICYDWCLVRGLLTFFSLLILRFLPPQRPVSFRYCCLCVFSQVDWW